MSQFSIDEEIDEAMEMIHTSHMAGTGVTQEETIEFYEGIINNLRSEIAAIREDME